MLKTNRLFLRPLTQTDSKSFFAYRSDAQTNKYQSWVPSTLNDVEMFIDKVATEMNVPDTWFQLAITHQISGNLIGDIGIHFIGHENMQVELGCTLVKQAQGKGYATEALTAVIDYLFYRLKKHRITASIDPQNTASLKLVAGLGFRKEAHFIQSIFSNNHWADDAVFALLASEWVKNKNK